MRKKTRDVFISGSQEIAGASEKEASFIRPRTRCRNEGTGASSGHEVPWNHAYEK